MNILYVAENSDYLNPNAKYYAIVMKNLGAKFFGPGFSTDEELRQGLHRYIDKNNGFDLIVTALYPDYERFNGPINMKIAFKSWSQARFLYYSKNSFDFIPQIGKELYEINNTPLVYIFGADTYNISKNYLEPLKKDNIYTIAAGKQFTKFIDKKALKVKEKFSDDINNNFFDFVNEYDHKIISFFHLLGEDEFKFNSLSNRKYDISLLGVLYNHRMDILKKISNKGYKIPSTIHRKVYAMLNKLGVGVYSNYIFLSLYNLIFRYYLFNSKFSYTCGTELDTLVRKFFEIPAHGAVLITKNIFWLKDLGFKNGENFLSIERAEEIFDILGTFENNLDKIQQIASRGQNLIYENHTVSARTIQLKSAFEKIIAGDYKGSYWEEGKFILTPNNKR